MRVPGVGLEPGALHANLGSELMELTQVTVRHHVAIQLTTEGPHGRVNVDGHLLIALERM